MGFACRLDDNTSTVDLAQRVNLPVILVVGMSRLYQPRLADSASNSCQWPAFGGRGGEYGRSTNALFDENVQAIAIKNCSTFVWVMPRLVESEVSQAPQYLNLSLLK